MDGKVLKHSYTVSCSSVFRDAVTALAARKKVNAADLARSVLLVFPADVLAAFPDPGEPSAEDRETIVLKSGPAAGRPWRRKPRLQIRMAPGYEVPMVRRALGIALAMDQGQIAPRLEASAAPAAARPVEAEIESPSAAPAEHRPHIAREARDELERLRTIVSVLSFDPLPHGVRTRDEALHVLGFPPGQLPDSGTLKARFRMLATIHHPDGHYGSHQRMSQLNAAMDVLRRHVA